MFGKAGYSYPKPDNVTFTAYDLSNNKSIFSYCFECNEFDADIVNTSFSRYTDTNYNFSNDELIQSIFVASDAATYLHNITYFLIYCEKQSSSTDSSSENAVFYILVSVAICIGLTVLMIVGRCIWIRKRIVKHLTNDEKNNKNGASSDPQYFLDHQVQCKLG